MILFAGSERHLISEMFLSSAKPFYNSTKQLELFSIAPKVYTPFVCELFQAFGKTIQTEDILAVYRLYGGNTYCMQRTFHKAFFVTGVGVSCDRRVVRQIIEKFWKIMVMRMPVCYRFGGESGEGTKQSVY